jgi:hypothetical protein
MTRAVFIERVLRQIYGGQPSDDATITINLVNNWLNDATAVAAKKNYTDSLQLDGVAYMNNSFYTTFKGLTLLQDEDFLWKITLPELPLGIGVNDGVSRVLLKTPFTNEISYTVVLLTENQRSFARGMRTVQNKLLGYQESKYIYIETPFTAVYNYTASVTMVSGGDSTNLG